MNGPSLAENHGPLDKILQLADIARPGIGHQLPESILAELQLRQLVLFGKLAEKMLRQQQDVLRMFPQGRHGHGNYIEPVVEVFAETTFLDQCFQVAMGRRDDPDIDLYRQIRTHGIDLFLLQNTQYLGLQEGTHIADLIQEDGPPIGLQKLSLTIGGRPGEGALPVAEKLRLQELLRNGGAVHPDKGPLGAGAVVMDRMGNELFTGAALASYQHG